MSDLVGECIMGWSSKRPHRKIKGKMIFTTRLIYVIADPTFNIHDRDQLILHKCDNGTCINLNHLYMGTQKDNVADRVSRGRDHNKSKTHCPNGHEYKIDTRVNSKGWRTCRPCDATKAKKYRERKALERLERKRLTNVKL